MYKTKDKLQLVILIILILMIPIIFISFEFINKIRAVSKINSNEIITNTLDDIYNNILATPKNNDSAVIRNTLTEIFNLMNEKDYTSLYALLADDIKTLHFPSEESFRDYMETYLGDELYSPRFSKYERLNKEENTVFILKVDFLPYSTDESTILDAKESIKTDTFTIYLNDDFTYKFSFLKYIGSGKSTKSVLENDVLTCKLVSTQLYTSHTIFNIEFTNKTQNDIFIDDDGISVTTGLSQKYYSSSVFIPANDTLTISFTVYTGFNLKECLPSKINFKGIHTNGNVYMFSLPIKYPISLYGF